MTKKLAALLILLVLVGVFAFLYNFSSKDPSDNSGLGISFIGGETYEVEEASSLPAAGFSAIDASSISAEVILTYAETDQITAHFWGTVKLSNTTHVPKLIIKEIAGQVKIEVEPRGIAGYNVYQSNLKLEVTLPEDFNGALTLKSVSGSISVPAANASSLDLDTVSGAIIADKLIISGTLKANSISGAIEITDATAKSFSASTISGHVSAYTLQDALDIELSSISGSLILGMPSYTGFHIEATTVSGSVSCDFPIRTESSSSRRLVGTSGDGATNLKMTTVSGSINVNSK
jgi:lia operon protein LiaG